MIRDPFIRKVISNKESIIMERSYHRSASSESDIASMLFQQIIRPTARDIPPLTDDFAPVDWYVSSAG